MSLNTLKTFMDPIRNPFAPGAGSQPPELAGRAQIIDEASISIQRVIIGRDGRPQMILGLRGEAKRFYSTRFRK